MATVRIRDALDRELVFVQAPRRIVSLVPSETDMLFALGLGDAVVGRTRYCVEPAGAVEDIPSVGGTKDADVDIVAELMPDLVLANQEENSRANLEAMALRGLPVYVSFPRRVADGISHLAQVARLCGVARDPGVHKLIRRGYEVVREAEASLVRGRKPSPKGERRGNTEQQPPVPTFVPIWMDPLMTFNADTVASDMLRLAGARNVFDDRIRLYPLKADIGQREPAAADQTAAATSGRDTRYPRITLEEVESRAPELILLPDEPHEFTEADAGVFRGQPTPAAARGAIRFASGKDLFWYGAWSINALPRLQGEIARSARP